MRIRWRKSFIGYKKSMVLKYISTMENEFINKKNELSTEQQEMETCIAQQREMTYINKSTDHAIIAPLGSNSFQKVLFGLDKQNVKRNVKRIEQLQTEELNILYEKVAAARMKYEKWIKSIEKIEETEQTVIEQPLTAGIEDEIVIEETVIEETLIQEAVIEETVIEESVIAKVEESAIEDVIDSATIAISEPEKVLPDNSFFETQGTNLPGKLLNFRKRGSEIINHPNSQFNVSSPNVTLRPSSKKTKVVGMGFWEDADHYLEQTAQESFVSYNTTLSESAAAVEVAEPERRTIKQDSSYFAHQEAAEPSPNSISNNKRSGIDRRTNNNSSSVSNMNRKSDELNSNTNSNNTESVNEAGSPAVTDEIKHLRLKYIVGKIAGADLLDVNGHPIVSRNQPITETVMARADQNGKLAELIVSMIIPGLED